MSAKIIVDPTGHAHVMTITAPSSALVRLATEREEWQPRQTVQGGSEFQTLSLATTEAPRGTMSIRLTGAESATFQEYIDDHIMGGAEVELYPDSTDAGTHTDVIVVGSPVVVEWVEVIHDRFQLDLPVVIVNEAP